MLSVIGKYVGGKVVTALCVIASVGAGIWFWRHPEDLRALWSVIRLTLAWIGLAVVLPWTSYPILPCVLKRESNAAGLALLLGYCAIDLVVALWLAGWGVHGALSWTVLLLGCLAAAAYNYVVCESLARHLEA